MILLVKPTTKKQVPPPNVRLLSGCEPHQGAKKQVDTHSEKQNIYSRKWQNVQPQEGKKHIKPNMELGKLWNDNHTSSLPKFASFVRTY